MASEQSDFPMSTSPIFVPCGLNSISSWLWELPTQTFPSESTSIPQGAVRLRPLGGAKPPDTGSPFAFQATTLASPSDIAYIRPCSPSPTPPEPPELSTAMSLQQ